MSYTAWLRERFSVALMGFGRGYMPYERTVCLWGYDGKLLCELLAAGGMAWWWTTVAWPALVPVVPARLLALWACYTVWKAGWLGGFAWADLGLGEGYFKSLIHRPTCDTPWGLTWFCCGGTSYVPNIFNTTLEAFEGPKEKFPILIRTWQDGKYKRLRAWDGDPGNGEFGHD